MGKGEIACYEACFPEVSRGVIVWEWVNSLPYDKNMDWSKLKAFADDKLNATEKSKFVLGCVENIVGKNRKCWFPAFSPFPTNVFNRLLSCVVKSGLCGKKLISLSVWHPPLLSF